MASLADMIEEMIKDLIAEHQGFCEISRNALAEEMNVVPSQVSYVIATRFKPSHGYLVESRRGGGGSIRITEIESPEGLGTYCGDEADEGKSQHELSIMLGHLYDRGLINNELYAVFKAAISDQVLGFMKIPERDMLRVQIFNNMLKALAVERKESN